MRKVIVIAGFLLYSHFLQAQNVGIGTNTPQSKLDIKGDFRTGGLNNFLLYDSSGRFNWSNSYIWAPAAQYLMRHSASSEGLYYGNGQLEYRYQDGSPRFFTNWNTGNGYFHGNLGIGTTTPGAKIHIANGPSGYNGVFFPGAVLEGNTNTYFNLLTPFSLESAILFGTPINLATAGIAFNSVGNPGGLQFRTGGNLTRMQIDQSGNVAVGITPAAAKFHVGSGTVRIEGPASPGGNALSIGGNGDVQVDAPGFPAGRFVVKENGLVGIGTNNPAFKLDVADRMRIRSGGGFSSAGLYLNNNNNTASPAFIGMHDDNHVGLWGNNTGWGFTMNTDNGALKVNGNEGGDKQVLTSAGSGGGSSWKTLGSLIQTYSKTPPFLLNFEGTLSSSNQLIVFSALTTTITVTTKSRLIISAGFRGSTGSCFGCGDSWNLIDIRIDGVEMGAGMFAGVVDLEVGNGSIGSATISNFLADVNTGTHTIEFIAQGTANMNVSSKYSSILVLPID